jgi:hypothetical protein
VIWSLLQYSFFEAKEENKHYLNIVSSNSVALLSGTESQNTEMLSFLFTFDLKLFVRVLLLLLTHLSPARARRAIFFFPLCFLFFNLTH